MSAGRVTVWPRAQSTRHSVPGHAARVWSLCVPHPSPGADRTSVSSPLAPSGSTGSDWHAVNAPGFLWGHLSSASQLTLAVLQPPPGAEVSSRLLCGGEGARPLHRGNGRSGFPAAVPAGGARDGILASLTKCCRYTWFVSVSWQNGLEETGILTLEIAYASILPLWYFCLLQWEIVRKIAVFLHFG